MTNKTNRQFVCDFIGCGKQFKSKVYLRKHRKIHRIPGSEIFVCDFIGCGYQTHSAVAFRDHLNIHSGLKPHKCKFCDKAFASESVWRTHQAKSHYSQMNTGESYKCRVKGCGRLFNNLPGRCYCF